MCPYLQLLFPLSSFFIYSGVGIANLKCMLMILLNNEASLEFK
jgi:hypothetical protein